MIMMIMSIDFSNLKSSGRMPDCRCANRPPAMPALAALIVNAATFKRVVGVAIASAAISSSRMAMSERPVVDWGGILLLAGKSAG